MKIKNINQNLFEEIKKRSFDSVKKELVESSVRLSKALGVDFKVSDINESYVVYSSPNPYSFLKASYEITDRGTIKLENFETLIVDKDSIAESRKSALRGFIESLIDNDKDKAEDCWKNYMSNINIQEMVKKKAAAPGRAPGDPANPYNADEEDQSAQGRKRIANKKPAIRGDEEMSDGPNPAPSSAELMTLKAVDPSLEEHLRVLPNYMSITPKLVESAKNVARVFFPEAEDVKISTKKNGEEQEELDSVELNGVEKSETGKKMKKGSKKNREKIFDAREKFAKNEKNENFIQKLVDIKRFNNAQEADSLSETLTDFVSENATLIYVSKDELKDMIQRIYDSKGEENWDEDLCEEIAFGLRKLAFNTYIDKAFDIARSAAIDEVMDLEEEVSEDSYEAFEEISSRYFNNIYENHNRQSKVLSDLSEMLVRTADTLEADIKSAGLENVGNKTIAEFRQYAAQMAANTRGHINESIVKMVVGSLLSGVGNDYSLNDKASLVPFGHFRPSIDLEKDYGKWVGDGSKDSRIGDEEMKSPNTGNPLAPKYMDKNKLDLEDGKYKHWSDRGEKEVFLGDEEMSGVNAGNPSAPKYMTSKQLDLQP
jgi:translation elongation factor EF-1beta